MHYGNLNTWIKLRENFSVAYDKAARRKYRRRIAGEIDIIESGGASSSTAGIRPKGRAPRGQGGEYAARRQIADKLDTVQRDISYAQGNLNRSRGQSKYRRRDTAARAKIQLLSKAQRDAAAVVRTGADWTFKRDMVNVIIGAARAQYQS